MDHGVTGFLHDDVTDLAAALGRVGDLDRTQCRKTAETRFSTPRMVADHVDLYADLIARRVRRGTPRRRHSLRALEERSSPVPAPWSPAGPIAAVGEPVRVNELPPG